MDTQRIIALVVFVFSGTLLWEGWNKHNQPHIPAQNSIQAKNGAPMSPASGAATTVPTPSVPQMSATNPAGALPPVANVATTSKRVLVETDSLAVELDTLGGDVRKVTLLHHMARGDATKPFLLLQDKPENYFIAPVGSVGTRLAKSLGNMDNATRQIQT